jgi:hypothetical protein
MPRQLTIAHGVDSTCLTPASCACCSLHFAGRVCQDVGQAAAAGSAAHLRWEVLLSGVVKYVSHTQQQQQQPRQQRDQQL